MACDGEEGVSRAATGDGKGETATWDRVAASESVRWGAHEGKEARRTGGEGEGVGCRHGGGGGWGAGGGGHGRRVWAGARVLIRGARLFVTPKSRFMVDVASRMPPPQVSLALLLPSLPPPSSLLLLPPPSPASLQRPAPSPAANSRPIVPPRALSSRLQARPWIPLPHTPTRLPSLQCPPTDRTPNSSHNSRHRAHSPSNGPRPP